MPMRRGPMVVLLLLCLALSSPTLAQGYLLGPRDVLKITVWGQADLSQDYPVSGDGFITFPLIGRVKVEGLTPTEIADRLRDLLDKDYLVNPQVLVSVADYRSKKVYVLGETEKPGLYVLTGPTTLLDILSQAGGPSKSAGKQLILVRSQHQRASGREQSPRKKTILRLNIDKIQAGEIEENVVLQGGDTILIPKAAGFFVLGQVKSPGAYRLEKEMTILEGITIAGGFTDVAAPNRTKVIRSTPKGQEVITINMNEIIKQGRRDKAIPLMENDVIIVPESFF
ncbi:MAG: polysaccharide biosynthesis/export family protein [Dehalococcoidia bacterium]